MTSSAAAPALGLREIVATLCVAVGAGVVPALQPILLGAMMDAGRLTGEQLGQAATMEGVGMAVGTTFSSVFLRPRRLRLIVALALIAFGIYMTNRPPRAQPTSATIGND